MYIVFFRTIVIYLIVFIVMRLMGKRELGQMQPFEFVISIMIADVASAPVSNENIPISHGIIPVVVLLFMHIIISKLNLKSIRARNIICGKPRVLIKNGKIDEQALKKENFTINELQERLRGKDIFNLGDVEYAIIETSGQVNTILKPAKRNLKPEDFNIDAKYEGIAYDLVIDGKIMGDNLKKIGKNIVWLEKELNKFHIKPKEALVATLNGDGTFFCQKKSGEK